MHLSTLDNHALFTQLRTVLLREFGTVPDFGVIAGQAVASAMYEIANTGIAGPFNDIDVFVLKEHAPYCPHVDEPMPPALNEKGNIMDFTFVKNTIGKAHKAPRHSLHVSSFGCTLQDPISAGTYQVVYAHNDLNNPFINYIRVAFHNRHDSSKDILSLNAEEILFGFDINACQIGLDMATQRVVWTPAFQNFLFSHELKCTFFGTPMHTAVRLCKKHKEMPSLGFNIDAQMKHLQTARKLIMLLEERREFNHGNSLKGFLPGNIFSHVYRERFLRHADLLDPYFSLSDKQCEFSDTFTEITPEGKAIRSDTQTTIRDMYVLIPNEYSTATVNFFMTLFGNPRGHIGIRLEALNALCARVFSLCERPKIKAAADRLVIHLKDLDYSFKMVWLSRHLDDDLLTFRQLHANNFKKAEKVYEKHPGLLSAFDAAGVSELVSFAYHIRWLEKNNLHHYVGWLESNAGGAKCDPSLFETRTSSSHGPAYCVSMLDPDFKSKIKVAHHAYLALLEKECFTSRFNELLNLPEFVGLNDNIIELTSAKSLFVEGQFLGHCVGGYYPQAKMGKSFIFSVSTGALHNNRETRSTLQIAYSRRANQRPDHHKTKMEFVIRQHHGKGNQKAPADNEQVAQRFIEILNERSENENSIFNHEKREQTDLPSLNIF
jgi:hypothetical protein